MNKIKPILAKEQPFLWKQAIRQAEKRGYNMRTIFLAPLLSHQFAFKNHQSYLFDHLIVGSNPILTYLTILNLHALSLETVGTKSINIGVLFTDEPDYWAYHLLEKPEFWEELKEKTNSVWSDSFKSLLEKKHNLFLDPKQHQLSFIHSSNITLHSCRYDQYIDGYVLHLKDKEQVNNSYIEKMPTLLTSEQKLANKYKKQLFDFFAEHSIPTHEAHHYLSSQSNYNHYHHKMAVNQLIYPDEKVQCEDNPMKTHLLLAKKVWLTSQPTGWLHTNIEQEEKTVKYGDSDVKEMTFNHILSPYSFGTSKHVANDFLSLELQTLYDIIEVSKMNLIDLMK